MTWPASSPPRGQFTAFRTRPACRALAVSQAWLYKWRDGDASPRQARRAQLAITIGQLFAAHHGKYGSPRITDDLREAGWRVSEKTVAAIMREQRLVARANKRRKHTTRQGKGRWRAPDLVGRDFPASTLNRKWYGDGTEIAHRRGQAVPGLGAGCGFAPGRRVRPGRAPRRRARATQRWRWPSRSAAANRRSPGSSCTPTVRLCVPVFPGFLTLTPMDTTGCWYRALPELPDPHFRLTTCVFPRICRLPGATR